MKCFGCVLQYYLQPSISQTNRKFSNLMFLTNLLIFLKSKQFFFNFLINLSEVAPSCSITMYSVIGGKNYENVRKQGLSNMYGIYIHCNWNE